MPCYHIARSISISAPLAKLADVLADFSQWPAWSPWLIIEPDTEVTYSDGQGIPGASYTWSGKLIGTGRMTLTVKTHSRLAMQVEFIEPDKSNATIEFDIGQAAGHSILSWHMYGEPPCAMNTTILNRASMDCERGLAMLKEYIERGEVLSSVSIDGLCGLARQDYVGISNRSTLRELPPVMQADFDKLYILFRENDWSLDVIPFSIYSTMQSSDTQFISAIPVSNIPADLAEPFTTGSITIPRGFRVTHTGAYENLGNAWSAAIQAACLHGHKPLMDPVGIERYHNDHETLPAAQLITEVLVPVA